MAPFESLSFQELLTHESIGLKADLTPQKSQKQVKNAGDRQPSNSGKPLMAVNTRAAPALRSASGESCPACGGL
jgi:hypothetical protein